MFLTIKYLCKRVRRRVCFGAILNMFTLFCIHWHVFLFLNIRSLLWRRRRDVRVPTLWWTFLPMTDYCRPYLTWCMRKSTLQLLVRMMARSKELKLKLVDFKRAVRSMFQRDTREPQVKSAPTFQSTVWDVFGQHSCTVCFVTIWFLPRRDFFQV